MSGTNSGVVVSVDEMTVAELHTTEYTVVCDDTASTVIVITDELTGSTSVIDAIDSVVSLEGEALGVSEVVNLTTEVVCLEVGEQGPQGAPGTDVVLELPADCLASDSVGDLVYVSGPPVAGRIQVEKVDIDDGAKMPAMAVIASKSSPTTCVIRISGEYTLNTASFTEGNIVFVQENGAMGTTPPPRPNSGTRLIQRIGIALTPTRVVLNIQPLVQEILPSI